MTAAAASTGGHFPYGYFAFVMATGIVSIAAGLLAMSGVARALFLLNIAAFLLLWVCLTLRLGRSPTSLIADLSDHERAPSLLTIVAATCVLGNQIAIMWHIPVIVAAFWIIGTALWAGLIYCFFAAMTARSEKPPLDTGVDGSWLLVVVTTEALAILTTHAAGVFPWREPVVFFGLCLFLLGGAFYAILLVLIVHRWLFLPMRPDQLTPSYWINMGAAAIAALAGTRILALLGADSAIAPVHDFVFAVTILCWSLATWWIPLLAALTLWRHRPGEVRLGYRLDNWSMVFPLGMYTAATWRFSHQFGLRFLDIVPQIFIWIALAAWCLAFAGMLRAAFRSRPGVRVDDTA